MDLNYSMMMAIVYAVTANWYEPDGWRQPLMHNAMVVPMVDDVDWIMNTIDGYKVLFVNDYYSHVDWCP